MLLERVLAACPALEYIALTREAPEEDYFGLDAWESVIVCLIHHTPQLSHTLCRLRLDLGPAEGVQKLTVLLLYLRISKSSSSRNFLSLHCRSPF